MAKDLHRIIDRIEKYAGRAINETAYALSYSPGSTRYHQARARADEAEEFLLKAVAELRAALPATPNT